MKKHFLFSLLFIGTNLHAYQKGFWGKWVENARSEATRIEAISMDQRTNKGDIVPYKFNDQEIENFKKNMRQIKITELETKGEKYSLELEDTPINRLLLHDQECLARANRAAEKHKKFLAWQEKNPLFLATFYNVYQKINPWGITTDLLKASAICTCIAYSDYLITNQTVVYDRGEM